MSLEMSSQMSCYCCCKCCDYYAFCDWCIDLCDCDCDYDCNCLAKYWFCNIDVCFPCIKTAILPCVLSILIPFISFCIAQHLVVACFCCLCFGGASKNTDNSCDSKLKTYDDCDNACFWTPCIKMCRELNFCNGFMGYDNLPENERKRYFKCTSHKFMKDMFFTKSVTVQPVMQSVSVSSEIPHPYQKVGEVFYLKSEIRPPYEEIEVHGQSQAILPVCFDPNIREQWPPVSNV